MAISNAEAQKRWRQRQKEKRKEDQKKSEGSHWYVKDEFQTFLENHRNLDELHMPLQIMGLEIPEFIDGKPNTGSYELDLESPYDAPLLTAMGRADGFVGEFIAATTALARFVNEFKLKEIDARIKEIEAAELTDPAARKQALNDIVRLNKMRDQLSKQVRITLPQWKVTGEV